MRNPLVLKKKIHTTLAFKGSDINLRGLLYRLGVLVNKDKVEIPAYPTEMFIGTFHLLDKIVQITFKQFKLKAYIRLTLIPLSKSSQLSGGKLKYYGHYRMPKIKRFSMIKSSDYSLYVAKSGRTANPQTSIFF